MGLRGRLAASSRAQAFKQALWQRCSRACSRPAPRSPRSPWRCHTPPSQNDLGLLAIVANAYAVAGVLHWRARKLPAWTLPLALAWGSSLITGVAYFSGASPSPLVFFYLWIPLYASYFLTRREAALQVAYVGLAYAALLALRPPSSGAPAWWIVGMGTLLVAAIVITTMRVRVELLISRLYDTARTDALTSLANRRGFRELLDLELERARRGETEMTVLVGDLDRFKEVNDRSGHQVGDAALQRVARLLNEGKRQIDSAARVGGEEFALILPDSGADGAFVLAERLRSALAGEFAEDSVAITISFGLATYPEHGETAASLLRAADEALYAAKDSGRNRTVRHSPLLRELVQTSGGARDIEGERFLAVMLDLAEAVDLRFSGSARHSETVGRYAEMMARELGLSDRHVSRVRLAGMLHDIGKIGVPDEILRKPGTPDRAGARSSSAATPSSACRSSNTRVSPTCAPGSAPITSAPTAWATRSASRAMRSRWRRASWQSPTLMRR